MDKTVSPISSDEIVIDTFLADLGFRTPEQIALARAILVESRLTSARRKERMAASKADAVRLALTERIRFVCDRDACVSFAKIATTAMGQSIMTVERNRCSVCSDGAVSSEALDVAAKSRFSFEDALSKVVILREAFAAIAAKYPAKVSVREVAATISPAVGGIETGEILHLLREHPDVFRLAEGERRVELCVDPHAESPETFFMVPRSPAAAVGLQDEGTTDTSTTADVAASIAAPDESVSLPAPDESVSLPETVVVESPPSFGGSTVRSVPLSEAAFVERRVSSCVSCGAREGDEDLGARFRAVFDQIEGEIRRRDDSDPSNGPISLAVAINHVAECDPLVRTYKEEIFRYVKPRNLMTHRTYGPYPSIVPHRSLVESAERTLRALRNPIRVVDLLDGRSVMSADPTWSIHQALAIMNASDFSQIPVVSHTRGIIGLLTETAVVRWMTNLMADEMGGARLRNATAGDLVGFSDPGTYEIAPMDMRAEDALALFSTTERSGRNLVAILITADGTATGELHGVVTTSDLPKIYSGAKTNSPIATSMYDPSIEYPTNGDLEIE